MDSWIDELGSVGVYGLWTAHTGAINKSLSALADVMTAIGSGDAHVRLRCQSGMKSLLGFGIGFAFSAATGNRSAGTGNRKQRYG
jgi:hypothetical protein